MPRTTSLLLVAGVLLLAGCAEQPADVADSEEETPSSVTAPVAEITPAVEDPPTSESTAASDEAADAPAVQPESATSQLEPQPAGPLSLPEVALAETANGLTPVPIESGVVKIGPENTEIQFVGRHADDRPDRVGVFQAFSGEIQVDPQTQAVSAISVEIQTESLVTQIDRLTNHLKSPDFFEVREYPTATFESAAITSGSADENQHRVTGNLTLHGVTKEISFPATVGFAEGGLTMTCEFIIDRSEFEMNFGPDQVENDVMMTVRVGEKTDLPPAENR